MRDGDPALQRLQAALVVDRQMILDHSPELQADRKKLLAFGRLWDQCEALSPRPAATGEETPARADFEHYLAGEESLAAALASPMDKATHATLTANARLAEKLDPEEARTILRLQSHAEPVGSFRVGHRPEIVRGGPRPFARHADLAFLRPRVAGRGQENPLGPRQADGGQRTARRTFSRA